jgi:hypothetical protein
MMRQSYRGSLDPNVDVNQLQEFLNLRQVCKLKMSNLNLR